MIEVRWHGRGGQGCFTAARLLGISASVFEGKYSLAFPSFGPERRGAPVSGFTRIDHKKITDRSEVKECDYVVVLDETLVNKNTAAGLKPGGSVLINTKDPGRYEKLLGCSVRAIDATSIALDILKRPITNTAMLGALVAASEIVSLESAIKGVEAEMGDKKASKNIEVLKKSYETVKGAC